MHTHTWFVLLELREKSSVYVCIIVSSGCLGTSNYRIGFAMNVATSIFTCKYVYICVYSYT